jgi:DNA-binding NtrC family response regulator
MSRKISLEVQSLIDAQDNPFALIDANYNIVSANKAYRQAYRTSANNIVGRKCHEVSHRSRVPCDQNGEACPHRQLFSSQQPNEVLHIHYDTNAQPEHVRIKASPVFGPDGELYLGESIVTFAHGEDLDCVQQQQIGKSSAFVDCLTTLAHAAATDAPVLLLGEPGVGKDLAAEYIHTHSQRNGHSFTIVDCKSFEDSALESELFGQEPGAFTACGGRRYGMFEQSNGGTLFFSEIAELPMPSQQHLLRTMKTGQFQRVGGHRLIAANVRVICASGANLQQLLTEKLFDAEFYRQIAEVTVEIPPLRKRRVDIPALANALLQRMGTRDDPSYQLTDDAVETLLKYDYPGNVRELRHILQHAAALSSNGIISAWQIHFRNPPAGGHDEPACHFTDEQGNEPSMKNLESRYISELLAEHHGKRAKVAEILGISERTLYRKLKLYGLQEIGRQD